MDVKHSATTPNESMRELRIENSRSTPLSSRSRASSIQSCVDLMDVDSPCKYLSSPRKGSFDTENRDPGFRTPNLCSRPSFRDKFRSRPRAGTLFSVSKEPFLGDERYLQGLST